MPLLIRGIFSGGGGKIKDATALPENVEEGKIFYNNNGRQVGTKQTVKTKMLDFPQNSSSSSQLNKASYRYRTYCEDRVSGLEETIDTYLNYEWMQSLSGATEIISVIVNGEEIRVPPPLDLEDYRGARYENIPPEIYLETEKNSANSFIGMFVLHNGRLYGTTGEKASGYKGKIYIKYI